MWRPLDPLRIRQTTVEDVTAEATAAGRVTTGKAWWQMDRPLGPQMLTCWKRVLQTSTSQRSLLQITLENGTADVDTLEEGAADIDESEEEAVDIDKLEE